MVYIAIPLSILFFCILLAVYILWSDRKNTVNKFFVLQIFSVSFWIFCNFMADIAETAEANLFWSRITLIGASLVAVFFYFFSLHFPKEKPSNPVYKYIVSFFGLLIIILSPTEWNIVSVYSSNGGFGINTGFLYIPFLFYFALTVIFSVFNFIHRADTDIEKIQVKFVITGIVLSIIFGFLTNAILPVLGNSQYVSLGSYFVVFFLVSTFYAIIKHHLFDIRVIATELFTLVLWIILLIKIFFANGTQDLIINIGIFASVAIVGILLVRSVIKEVQQREKMEQMAEDVKRAYEVEKRANEELKKLDEVKNQFLMQTQHDLRTPLSTIRGYCDLLINGTFGKQPKDTIDVLKRIEIVAEDKIKDVNNFLDVTQFQLGKKVVNLSPGINLNEILAEIQDRLEPNAAAKGIYLKLENLKSNIIIEADREKLKSALFNIVDNSIKYTTAGGVSIAASNSRGAITIEIKDTGVGMTEETRQKLFDTPFERGEEAKKMSVTGRGIGLYLSSKIIAEHHGKIWAESKGPGRGSAFYVELPA